MPFDESNLRPYVSDTDVEALCAGLDDADLDTDLDTEPVGAMSVSIAPSGHLVFEFSIR